MTPRADAGQILGVVTAKLVGLQLELGEIQLAETEARARALVEARAEGVNATQQRLDAEAAAADFVGERRRYEADLNRALHIRDCVQFGIKYNLEGAIHAAASLVEDL